MTQRPYDITVFGATGFTGRLVAAELAHAMRGRLERLALAGRDRGRLRALRDRLAARQSGAAHMGIEKADTGDPRSLAALAGRTRVLATTVGPFVRHGPPVVEACVAAGTDYVDITGEPAYFVDTIAAWDAPARRRGVRVVCCCGFDAVPADYGTWLTVRQLPEDRPVSVESFVFFGGRLSGGTWNTALTALDPRRATRRRVPPPTDGRRVATVRPRARRAAEVDGWVIPLPTIDPQVVARSAGLLAEYGPAFTYAHSLRVGSVGALGATVVGAAALRLAARSSAARALLGRLAPSGSGPDARRRARSSFRVLVRGSCDVDGRCATASTEVSGGDPGYDETAVMLAQSALCLVDDRPALPDRAGVLSPVTAFGEVLLARLRAAGLRFAVRP
jgi:saccharopine dehydrogenase (NAD+, L-glutamate forming)